MAIAEIKDRSLVGKRLQRASYRNDLNICNVICRNGEDLGSQLERLERPCLCVQYLQQPTLKLAVPSAHKCCV